MNRQKLIIFNGLIKELTLYEDSSDGQTDGRTDGMDGRMRSRKRKDLPFFGILYTSLS